MSAIPDPRSSRGWWRRNMWALILLLPVVLVAVGSQLEEAKRRYFDGLPHDPVLASADGWVAYADGRTRLTGFGPVTVTTYSGDPFPLSSRVTVWQAKFDFEVPEPKTLRGCDFALEDQAGNVYDDSPSEVLGADTPITSCTPSYETPDATSFSTVVTFATPATSKPMYVRMILTLSLPRYAQFPVSS